MTRTETKRYANEPITTAGVSDAGVGALLGVTSQKPVRPFRLLRWFALVAGGVIVAIALANAVLMSRFLNQQLFQREATLTRDFVHNLLVSDASVGYFSDPQNAVLQGRFDGSMLHLANLRDVLRANVYSRERRVLWSSNRELVGRSFADNDELDEALRGEMVVHAGDIRSDPDAHKGEHAGLAQAAQFFVETYIPIRDERAQLVGVVELYKAPVALTEAIHAGRRWAAASALLGALLLFGGLFWIVHRGDRMLRAQQAQLLEAETLAVVGQLAAAVAHNVRNPLASIRSSAELALDAPPEQAQACARDILHDADRISERIHELLRLAAPMEPGREAVDLVVLLARCAAEEEPLFARRAQLLQAELPAQPAWIRGDAQLLRHMLHSLLANAAEAMGAGGRCQLRLVPGQTHRIEIEDTGVGIAPQALQAVQRPFVTTKPQGLGLGLLLARRIAERLGGQLTLLSQLGVGTTVRIELPAA